MSQETNRIDVTTAFLVVVGRGGDVAVYSDNFPEVGVDRVATLTDVEAYCSQASREAGRLLEQAMRQTPDVESTPDRVRKAVTKRKVSG